ncbi:MAG: hypothetical protein OWS74_05485, partial [Firmicutes bacterium]|nr:hypothetical protein [Bacillota bacterium]
MLPAKKMVGHSTVKSTTARSSKIFLWDAKKFYFFAPKDWMKLPPPSVADTPWGVLYLLPPHWLSHESQWTLYLSPSSGTANLLEDRLMVAHWKSPDTADLRIADVTGNFCLLIGNSAPGINSQYRLWAVNLQTDTKQCVHQWNPAHIEGVPFIAGCGMVLWWNEKSSTATALQLSDGHQETIANVSSLQNIAWKSLRESSAAKSTLSGPQPHSVGFFSEKAPAMPTGYYAVPFSAGGESMLTLPDTWEWTSEHAGAGEPTLKAWDPYVAACSLSSTILSSSAQNNPAQIISAHTP